MRYYILGLGAVGQSFLKILIKEGEFNPDIFYCIDANNKVKDVFISLGGKPEHFRQLEVNKDTYQAFLIELNPGDYLLDFSTNVKNLTILEYALNHQIHYLFTADCSWKNDPDWLSIHQHFLNYKKLREKYHYNGVTSIIEFGMNPGLVSIFMKLCIRDIVYNGKGIYLKLMRRRLKQLLNDNLYNKVAKMLGVTLIEEIDVDTQTFNIAPINDTIYSPWNVSAFFYEEVSSPEIAYGRNKDMLKHKEFYDVDVKDQFIALKQAGIEYNEKTIYSKGEINTHLICHEEIYSMREYLTYNKYRPTVVFLYRSSELANQSVLNNLHNKDAKHQLLTKKEITGGGEEVGVLIQGKRFKPHYFANYLATNDLDESATIYQVSVGVYAAYKYMHKHPNQGFLFPEELDPDEIMSSVKKYLKEFISIDIDKVKLSNV